MRLVRGGEDTFLELKVRLSNPEKIAQEIVAIANTGGGVIVFGVNDQLRIEGLEDDDAVQESLARICREEIQPPLVPFIDRIAFDSGRRVVALDIDGRRRPYRTRDGRFFIRIGSEKREATREDLSALLDEARPLSFENVPAFGSHIEDIDEAHLWSFLRSFEGDAFTEARSANYPTGEALARELLLGVDLNGEVVPTIAGILLFGRDDRVASLLPRADITVTRFAGDSTQADIIERAQLAGNLLTLYESVLRFTTQYCDLWDDGRPRLNGTDVPQAGLVPRANYRRSVVLEAVTNALVHRDLALRDHTTRVNIFDAHVEVINPRRSSGFAPLAQKAIRYGLSQAVNPQIRAVFSSPAYGAKSAPGGLPALLRDARLFSGRKAEIHALNDEFRIRLFGI